jgi:hypothetical protein
MSRLEESNAAFPSRRRRSMRVSRWFGIGTGLILVWGCHATHESRSVEPFQEPQIEVKSVSHGQMYFCHASISLKNPHESPVWFLLPFRANDTLRRDGIFPAVKWKFGTPLEADAYDDDAGRAVLVNYYGDIPFYAILLPPRGMLEVQGLCYRVHESAHLLRHL